MAVIGPAIAAMGEVTAAELADAAADEESPLHNYFLWNDEEAARLYREETARHMMRSCWAEIEEEDGSIHTWHAFRPRWHALPSALGGGGGGGGGDDSDGGQEDDGESEDENEDLPFDADQEDAVPLPITGRSRLRVYSFIGNISDPPPVDENIREALDRDLLNWKRRAETHPELIGRYEDVYAAIEGIGLK